MYTRRPVSTSWVWIGLAYAGVWFTWFKGDMTWNFEDRWKLHSWGKKKPNKTTKTKPQTSGRSPSSLFTSSLFFFCSFICYLQITVECFVASTEMATWEILSWFSEDIEVLKRSEQEPAYLHLWLLFWLFPLHSGTPGLIPPLHSASGKCHPPASSFDWSGLCSFIKFSPKEQWKRRKSDD